MIRVLRFLCLACLALAVAVVLWPGPWDRADEKAAQDAQKFADLIASPDRVGWRLSEDPALRRAIIWDADGTRHYPPPDGLAPLAYELSEDLIRDLTRRQAQIAVSDWAPFGAANRELLYCQTTPAICLIYDREALETALLATAGALVSPPIGSTVSLALAIVSGLLGCGTIFVARQRREPIDKLVIDPERHSARRGTLEISLSPRDLKLLALLQARDGAVATKDELYDAGWGREYMPNSRALDQHMINLRRKLDPDKSRPAIIKTVHGVGYRLVQ